MGHSIDGVELAAQGDLDALAARVAKLESAPVAAPAALSEAQLAGAIRAMLLGGVAAPIGIPAAPAADTVSMVENGKITGAPFVTSAAGAIYKFDMSTPVAGPFAGFTVNMAKVNDKTAILKLGKNGVVYWFSDGVWRRFRDMDSINSGTVVEAPPTAAPATAPGSAPSAPGVVSTTDPTPNPIAPGSSGKVIPAAPGGLAAALASAGAGDTVQAAPGVYNESVGVAGQLVEGGGHVINPGTKSATYTTGAALDATGVGSLREGQGGFVLLADCAIKGWEVRRFGSQAGGHDGTGGIRNNRGGVFRIEDCYLHHNQMGIAPHVGDAVLMYLKNLLLLNNGLPGDPGYAHNIYSYARHLIIEGGITSIAEAGSGDGHAGKFGNAVLEIYGKNYFRAWATSCIDIPHGAAKPFIIKGDTTLEKMAGDANRVIFGYAAEDTANGNAGGSIGGATFIVPDDGQNYIFLSNGPVTLTNCKFLYTDGSPVKAGTFVVQGSGTVTGLPS